MADARNNMCGMWSMTCTPSGHGTLLEGIRSAAGDKAEILYAKGSNVYYDEEMEKELSASVRWNVATIGNCWPKHCVRLPVQM